MQQHKRKIKKRENRGQLNSMWCVLQKYHIYLFIGHIMVYVTLWNLMGWMLQYEIE